MNELRDHLGELVARTTNRGLGVIGRCSSINTIAPDIRPKLTERQTRLSSHETHAHARTGFALPCGAEVEVIDAGTDRFGKNLSFGRARAQEVISEVHEATVELVVRSLIIDQKDLLCQSFLLVYQIDVRA